MAWSSGANTSSEDQAIPFYWWADVKRKSGQHWQVIPRLAEMDAIDDDDELNYLAPLPSAQAVEIVEEQLSPRPVMPTQEGEMSTDEDGPSTPPHQRLPPPLENIDTTGTDDFFTPVEGPPEHSIFHHVSDAVSRCRATKALVRHHVLTYLMSDGVSESMPCGVMLHSPFPSMCHHSHKNRKSVT